MICLKEFKDKKLPDFNNWNEWVNFVNKNIYYSKTESKVFDWIGKCKASDLPSFHPYYNYLVNKERAKNLKDLKQSLEVCRIKPELIKYYFNNQTTIGTIEKKISDLELRMNS